MSIVDCRPHLPADKTGQRRADRDPQKAEDLWIVYETTERPLGNSAIQRNQVSVRILSETFLYVINF